MTAGREKMEKKSKSGPGKKRKRLITIFGAIVIFVTTYALILPAITMETPTYCGQTEHRHTSACFTPVLICDGRDQTGIALLFGTETKTELVCEKTAHTHEQACYDESGALVCTQEAHVHGENCYETVEVPGEQNFTAGLQRGYQRGYQEG